MSSLTVTIAASNEDAGEDEDGTDYSATETTHNIKSGSSAAVRRRGGFVFKNVTIPQGATINTCVWRVFVDNATSDNPSIEISFEDTDDAVDFTANADVASRTRIAQTVDWVTTGLGSGSEDSPSLVTPLQAMVNRGGWASGNDLCLLAWGKSGTSFNFAVRSFDHANNNPAQLVITYTAVGTVSLAGNQPAGTGTIAAQISSNHTVQGNQPASTGTLSAQQLLLRTLSGNQPAASGALRVFYEVTLSGNQPAASGGEAALHWAQFGVITRLFNPSDFG